MNKIFKKGFTLIELLVVIAIIAIITSIGTANLITAQKQARDSARREIIGNVQNAFEQYFAELGVYPSTDPGLAFETGSEPVDPKSPTTSISWTVAADTYCVCASMEMGNGNSTNAACAWSEASTSMYYCAKNRQ
jgi:prepilin-type N-terminal cleavage/methylation domain-containing protein